MTQFLTFCNYAGIKILLGFIPYCPALLRVYYIHNILFGNYLPLLAIFFGSIFLGRFENDLEAMFDESENLIEKISFCA